MSQRRGKKVGNNRGGRTYLIFALLLSLGWSLSAAGPAVSKAANYVAKASSAPSRLSVAAARGAAAPGVEEVQQGHRSISGTRTAPDARSNGKRSAGGMLLPAPAGGPEGLLAAYAVSEEDAGPYDVGRSPAFGGSGVAQPPDIRIEPLELIFPESAAMTAPSTWDANAILLKNRQFIPSLGGQLTPPRVSKHLLIQFAGYPEQDTLATLSRLRIAILEWVPKNAVMARVPAGADLSSVPGIRWAGYLRPEDKISRYARVSLERGFVLVDMFPDVASDSAELAIAAAGAHIVKARADLGPNTYLVRADPAATLNLSRAEEVSWIWAASEAVIVGGSVYRCEGPLTAFGPVAAYAVRGDGWDGPGLGVAYLTYHFENGTPDVAGNQEWTEFARALRTWSDYADITWNETDTPGLDRSVDIKWAAGAHGDADPFDGPGNVLAHAFYPPPLAPEPVAGDIHLDEDETWRVGANIDVFSVALHESGHSLGLDHSDNPQAVMYAYYRMYTGLHQDDIDAIRSIYASAGSGQYFTIFNDGGQTLSVTSIVGESPSPWISWWPEGSFDVAPGGQQNVEVFVDLAAAPTGSSTRRLLVMSNDPGESPYPHGVYITVNNTSPQVDLLADDIVLRTAPGGGGSVVTTPQAGQQLYPTFTWHGTGSGTLASVSQRIQHNGSPLCSGTADNVTAPASVTWWCDTPWTATEGTHSFSGDVDYTHSIAEVDEGNNSVSHTYQVGAGVSRDLEALGIVLRTHAGGGGSIITTPRPGQQLYPTFRWSFSGDAVKVTVEIRADGAALCTRTELGGGLGDYLTWCEPPWTATSGTHTLTGILDPTNAIPETNEGNNTVSRTYDVSGTPTPDRTPTPTPTDTRTYTPTPTVTTGTPDTTLRVGDGGGQPGEADVCIDVSTSNAITVGSSDLILTFDPAVLEATEASSTTLSGFTAYLDNGAGEVRTSSASATGDNLGPDGVLFTVCFSILPGAPIGRTALGLVDSDGIPPDDLGGVSPPIPPPSIVYAVDPGQILVGAGDIDCDGRLGAADAQVLLCWYVGLCQDPDFPPLCNDPAERGRRGDWDCNGRLEPADAAVTLGLVVGRFGCDITPLCKGLCPAGLRMPVSGALGYGGEEQWSLGMSVPRAAQRIELEINDAAGKRGEEVEVEVRTADAVVVGATDLTLRYDPRVLEVIGAESGTLSNFTYAVDAQHRVIRTASASGEGDELGAGEVLFRVKFRVREDARRRVSSLRLRDSDHRPPRDIGGVPGSTGVPGSIRFFAHAGHFRLLR